MTIDLYLKGRSTARKTILESIPQPYHADIVEHIVVKKTEIPRQADFVVHCGEGAPSSKAEFFAAQKKSFVVCLPEAMDWFQRKLDDAVSGSDAVSIMDATLHKIQAVI